MADMAEANLAGNGIVRNRQNLDSCVFRIICARKINKALPDVTACYLSSFLTVMNYPIIDLGDLMMSF